MTPLTRLFTVYSRCIVPLENGRQLGPYEIVAPLGAGGMGEVYKAKDLRLNRTVAVKVLPSELAEAERKQRFEREAQAIASLNHAHICVVHDVGQHEGIDFLVMELLEGETLADRLAKGPLPFDQLLTYAIQIGDALDKAHRQGVTHRDLKPGNIMLTKSGVKLLDFGLAKVQPAAVVTSQSILPTLATAGQPLTMQGTILGTLQYMSPEQVEGSEADARSDIFAFGAVLYEMATGRRPFQGKSQVSLIASILEHDPAPVSTLQPIAPPRFDDVVRVCLAKDPDERWQSASDLVHELKLLVRHDTVAKPVATVTGVSRRHYAIWAASLLLVGAGAVAATVWLTGPADAPRVSFEVQEASASGASGQLMLALSPDGRNLVVRVNEGGVGKLWVRPIGRVTGFSPQGTDGGIYPFWSPDGRYIGFFADNKLKKVDVFGAPPQELTEVGKAPPTGGTWSRDGVIIFSVATGPLFRIAASGGHPIQVTELDSARGEIAHRYPRFLPDGVHFLYFAASSKPEESGVYVGSLNEKGGKRLVASASAGDFAPPDLLLFLRESTLMAQRFDLRRLELSGEPFQIAEQVGSNPGPGMAGFSVSHNGVLAYRNGAASSGRQLIWIDRSGKPEGTVGSPALYENPRLSPDGKHLAVFQPDGGGDIWITDLERGTSTRFTFDSGSDNAPVWSPDGTKIAFVSNRDGGVFNLYQKSASGVGDDELLLKTANNKVINDWSADGRYILYEEEDPKTKRDLWVLPMFGDRKPMRVLGTPFNEHQGTFSQDARWIAYTSDESGRNQIYAQGFPVSKRKYQISSGKPTGQLPRWRPDGKELFYDAAGPMVAVDVSGTVAGGELKVSAAQDVFGGQSVLSSLPPHNFDVTPDGKRFLVVTNRPVSALATSNPIVVVVNWKSGLRH